MLSAGIDRSVDRFDKDVVDKRFLDHGHAGGVRPARVERRFGTLKPLRIRALATSSWPVDKSVDEFRGDV